MNEKDNYDDIDHAEDWSEPWESVVYIDMEQKIEGNQWRVSLQQYIDQGKHYGHNIFLLIINFH